MVRLATLVALSLLVPWNICAQSTSSPTAQQILNAQHLWGKDFDALKAQLETLQVVGPKLEIQSQKIVGSKELTPRQGALAVVKLNKIFANQTATMLAEAVSTASTTPMQVPTNSQVSHVAITRTETGKSQFLAPDLTTGIVLNMGKPDSVAHETLSVGVEGRPQVVTTYSYAGGAIVFQTSNYSPRLPETGERLIESVVIDTSKISNGQK
jgi:hypothetical protein